MVHRLLVVPAAHATQHQGKSQRVGLTSVCLGILRALDRLGLVYAFYKPVSKQQPDRSVALARVVTHLLPLEPMSTHTAEHLLSVDKQDELLEEIASQVEHVGKGCDVVVIEGLTSVDQAVYAAQLNVAIAKALDAELVFVTGVEGDDVAQTADAIRIASHAFGDISGRSASCIVSRLPVPRTAAGDAAQDEAAAIARMRSGLQIQGGFHVLGVLPERAELSQPRVKDVVDHLDKCLGPVRMLHHGDWTERRVQSVSLCAAGVGVLVDRMTTGMLLVTPGDREDVLLAAGLACLEGVKLAGVILTCGIEPSHAVKDLCQTALRHGLPLALVRADSYPTASAIYRMDTSVRPDDAARAELICDSIATDLDIEWLRQMANLNRAPRMTSAAFRYRLLEGARANVQTIVLPEGDEPRTIKAAAMAAEAGIASLVLLGEPSEISQVAKRNGVKLGAGISLVRPADIVDKYVAAMVKLRHGKGLTEDKAQDVLHNDRVVLATMMVAEGHVDGLVSGAVHTTANTIRPALQLVKTAPGCSIVSSVFFMCLPEQVLVYGDCAVNPNPTAEQLADIAIQSAETALAFGIEPRVAMISYATGASAKGAEIDKVRQAKEIALKRKPELLIDGPMQYDAATVDAVGRQKAPGSSVAGRATVFVFPDLNTGNTVYKAVQRSTSSVSVGPVLQGLARPVNDLSRGCLVEDIFFTIAITAQQASARLQQQQVGKL